jgi:excinuclease UvrABC nuclease subunit
MKRRYNIEDLVDVHTQYNKLQKTIDEYEWNGDFEKSDRLREELQHIRDLKDSGDIYYPLF